MKKTLVKIGSVLIVTAFMSAVTVAEKKPAAADDSSAKVKKLEALEAARAQLGKTMQEIEQLSDQKVSGYDAKNADINKNYEKTLWLINDAIQRENRKPEAERNADHLKAMNDALQNPSQPRAKFDYNGKFHEAKQRYRDGLYHAYDGLCTMYSGWTKMNQSVNNCMNVASGWTKLNVDILDTDLLKTMFELLEKSAVEVKSQQQEALAEMTIQVKAWQNALLNAKSQYIAWTGNEQATK